MPVSRFHGQYPFANMGCDYFGPLHVNPVYERNDGMFKVHIVLYTCAATRAVILEVVSSLDIADFVQSSRRFKARRGCPKLIISDNGSSFTSNVTQNVAAENFIKWQFNPAYVPWWAGQFNPACAPWWGGQFNPA